MKAIFNRELKAYFNSMLGYVYLTIFLLLTGAMFFVINLYRATASMTGFFLNINVWAVFLLPLLTMRMFSEDRKQKTEQLLLTAPVSLWEIVLGKYFAAVCVLLAGAAATLLYPVIIGFFGSLPIAETISCYVGFILLCMAVIAIGAFMSSLTESQIVAAVSTYGILIVLMFFGNIVSSISNEAVVGALLWLSPMRRFSEFTMGILSLDAVIYYISIIALFLFLTVMTFEKRRLK